MATMKTLKTLRIGNPRTKLCYRRQDTEMTLPLSRPFFIEIDEAGLNGQSAFEDGIVVRVTRDRV